MRPGASRRSGRGIALHLGSSPVQGARCGLQIAGLAEEVTEPDQRARHGAVAWGLSIVRGRLGAVDQRFVVVGREEEAATCLVEEMLERGVGQRYCEGCIGFLLPCR